MTIIVYIPTILRSLTNEQKRVEADGTNVIEIIDNLERQYPGIKSRLMLHDKLHRFINLYVNDTDIRFSGELETKVKPDDTIMILPAVAGG